MGVGDQGPSRRGGGVILGPPRGSGRCLTSPLGGAGRFALLSPSYVARRRQCRGPQTFGFSMWSRELSVPPAGLSCKVASAARLPPLPPQAHPAPPPQHLPKPGVIGMGKVWNETVWYKPWLSHLLAG